VAQLPLEMADTVAAFIGAACVPRNAWHSSGTLERAEAILAAHPEVASSDIHTAAILGDAAAVRRFLVLDACNATTKGGAYGWDALTHLCFFEVSASRSQEIRRFRCVGEGAVGCWSEREYRLDGVGSRPAS
jgi:hypothetical protein